MGSSSPILGRFLTSAILLIVLTPPCLAQNGESGGLFGRVVDTHGLGIPDVSVTIASTSSPRSHRTQTAIDGSYAIQRVPAGPYAIILTARHFDEIRRYITLPARLAVRFDVALSIASVVQAVQVTAEPSLSDDVPGQSTYHAGEIELLAVPRTPQGIAQLAPGVTDNAPSAGQIAISGGFAFDNSFRMNGVDVADNIFAVPFNLFIEDAIERTDILTAAIPVEFGRFTGGVVNAVSKSGTNVFHGSWRGNLSSPSWSTMTPLERCVAPGRISPPGCVPAAPRPNRLHITHEATVGGPFVRNHLWFFVAARAADVTHSGSLPRTNRQTTQNDVNRRLEVKISNTLTTAHHVEVGYFNNSTRQTRRPTLPSTIDPYALGDRRLPNWYASTQYHTVLRNWLVQAFFAERAFRFEDSHQQATAIVESPFLTLARERDHYNAPFFDGSDPESRRSRQFTATAARHVIGNANVRHDLKIGYDFARHSRTGGNSQSATGYVFNADYAADSTGVPLYDSEQHLIPVFAPGVTLLEHWLPAKGAALHSITHTLFARDRLTAGDAWSADVGFRYEWASSETSGDADRLATSTFVPRITVARDMSKDGRHIARFSYSWYSGRYNEFLFGANNNVGNPDLLLGVYVGPAGAGRAFLPGFDPDNYLTVYGQFPAQNVRYAPRLRAAIAKEFALSLGNRLFDSRAYIEAAFIHRNFDSIVEDYIRADNGFTKVVADGFDVGTFTNIVYENTDLARRQYDTLVFDGRYSVTARWSVNGHYTLQLTNNGNYEGEATNQPGVPSRIGDYPEIFTAIRHYPDGRLDEFQRHKVRIWTIYSLGLPRFGDLSLSALSRIDSGTTYTDSAAAQPITPTQRAKLIAAGYPDAPASQAIFFGERGANVFNGFQVWDLAATYNVPVFRSLRPYLNLAIYNAFNNQTLIRWNTTVTPDATAPVDGNGIPTNFVRGSIHGLANNNNQFPVPSIGGTGGRTWRFAAGFRF
jgi:hypothetical protein